MSEKPPIVFGWFFGEKIVQKVESPAVGRKRGSQG